MKPELFFLFLLFTFNFLLVAPATTRYVSKTGSRTLPYTSWAAASDSIQKCINICQNGDTIYVANGVYKENLVINQEIALIGSSMDSTVIDGRGLGDITITVNKNSIIENINIYGKEDSLSGDVAAVFSAAPMLIRNCHISKSWHGVNSISSSLNAENLYMNSLINGFSLLEISPGNCTINNCVIFLRYNHVIGISVGYAPYSDYHINNNIIIYNRERSNYTGNGIYLGLPRRVYINNNLISGFTDNIFVDDIIDTVFVNNNVLVQQTTLSSNPASIIALNDVVIIDNVILSSNKKGIHGDSLVISDYNLYWENDINLQGLLFGASDREADPMFVKDQLPDSTMNFDFHLQAFSPGIDKGDPNIIDKNGTRSDIGMYGGPFGEIYTYQDLAPKPPRNLSAVVDTNQITLRWNKNTEADTAYYKVYRDTVPDFNIDSTKLISSAADTIFIQSLPQNINKYVYKVTCVDNQGNESNPSEELVINLTAIRQLTDDYPMTINDYFLYQNFPNPFNPSTTIGYKLKQRGYVKLMVYDIKGECLKVLVNQEQEAGYYEVEFERVLSSEYGVMRKLASGIYLYSIEVIGEGNIPVYTEMKKMLMIK